MPSDLNSEVAVQRQRKSREVSRCSGNFVRLVARWDQFKIKKTRHPELGYTCIEAGFWQFLDIQNYDTALPQIGPFYRSEKELLSDVDNFFSSRWSEESAL